MDHAFDGALLLLRLFFGTLMAAHGAQKLFGWFNGYGIAGTGGYFESLGYPNGRLMSVLSGLTESGGGVLLAAGFLTPLVSLGFVALFLNVAVAGHDRSFWNHNQPSGVEYPLVLSVAAAIFALAGPGAYSVDRAAGWHLSGWGWFAGSVVLGLAIGAGALGLRRPTVDAETEQLSDERAAA